jgi:tetratricopeptide (TPR) repeat protein
VTLTDSGDIGAQAAEALRLVQVQPQQAQDLARSTLAAARSRRDHASASTAHRALGLVAKERNDFKAAREHLRAAIRLAQQADDETRAAEARMSLSLVLAHCGRTAEALREADLAVAVLRGADGARAHMQRALVLQQLGRFDEALEGYRRSYSVLHRSGDRLWEARVLGNRGVLHTYRRDFRAAEADLRRADELFSQLGVAYGAGMVRHNLGYMFACKGDVPAALHEYDRAADSYRDAGVEHPVLLFDRGELLLGVRLVAEARQAAERAVAELSGKGMALRLAEGNLMLSQAALLDRDPQTARRAAQRAARAFAAQDRPAYAALARYAGLRAAWEGGDRSARLLASARATAEALQRAGWPVAALDARVLACRAALELGRVEDASRELALASRARNRGPVELRARAWHAKALLSLARGDRRGALDALRSGMTVLDEYRATLGATELRAHLSGHGTQLAALGLRLALEDARAAAVFEWSERWRAGALRNRPARPPQDPALAGELAELRRVVQERDQAALAGDDTAALVRRQAELEEAVRRRSRRVAGARAEPATGPPTVARLQEALGHRALLEISELDGVLHAVTVSADGARLRSLGESAAVARELAGLTFALRRLARRGGSAASRDAAAAAVAHAAAALDRVLLKPVEDDVGERPLVIVPTGALHATPWSLLPTCRGRPVVVSPCAEMWWRAETSSGRPSGPAVLVAGPNLAHADEEVAALAERYPDAVTLSAEAARAAGVLAALDGAVLGHIAAHGSFRADNPLFSCLDLSDGPLTVYDLESLERAPSVLVLSACESGLSSVQPGDELMGLAAALLEIGTRTLIASVVDVPDDQTARLMVAVHDRLREGTPPAEALCQAQGQLASENPRAMAAAAAFVCFGSG